MKTLKLLIVFVLIFTSFSISGHASADDDGLAAAIQELQPATSDARAQLLAHIFSVAANESNLDPLLLIAISMRESSLLESVERGEQRGSLGEIGLMQSHGVSLRYRPSECNRSLEWDEDGCDDECQERRRPACQILTGARFLAAVRGHCGGSWWRWVGSYGSSRCMSEDEARAHRSTRRARSYYIAIGGEDWL